MMKVDGTVADNEGKPVAAYITLTDLNSGKRVHSSRPAADGSYSFYVMEGSKYEMSVDPEQSNVTYFARQFDLTSDKISQREKVPVTLKPIATGDELPLNNLKFKPFSADLEAGSDAELKRLARLVKANQDFTFEIQVQLHGYEEDSVRSSPDLTEMIMDSINTQVDRLDSAGLPEKVDTVIVKARYHNDRTGRQANTIVEQLTRFGINRDKLTVITEALPATPTEGQKLLIKAVARKD
jgi:hypothetical protein